MKEQEPSGSKDSTIGLSGLNTIMLMVFGPQSHIIWVLGPFYPLKRPKYLGPWTLRDKKGLGKNRDLLCMEFKELVSWYERI